MADGTHTHIHNQHKETLIIHWILPIISTLPGQRFFALYHPQVLHLRYWRRCNASESLNYLYDQMGSNLFRSYKMCYMIHANSAASSIHRQHTPGNWVKEKTPSYKKKAQHTNHEFCSRIFQTTMEHISRIHISCLLLIFPLARLEYIICVCVLCCVNVKFPSQWVFMHLPFIHWCP